MRKTERNGAMPDANELGRGLPVSLDAERYVLGAILTNDSLYMDACGVLAADDFSLERHRRIFRRMGDLSDRLEKIDHVTLANELTKRGELEACDGLSYLVSLDDGMPRYPNIDSYIRIVKDKANLRRVIFASQCLMNRALLEEGTLQEIIEEHTGSLLEIGGDIATEAQTPEQIVHGYPGGINEFLDPSKRDPGVQTGYIRLDDMTGGFRPGELIILAGRPSSGKSSLSRNIAQYVSLRRHQRAVIFTLEMSKEQVLQTMACSVARLDSQRFRMGLLAPHERDRLMRAMTDLNASQLLIDETAVLTVSDFRSRVRKIQKRYGPVALAVVDYLQLMGSKGKIENRTQEVSAQSRGLKIAAKELQVPVLALSQLSRAVETRKGDHRPQLSDLRESGTIEQDADIVAFVYRGEMYDKDREDLKGRAELILEKQRGGPTGTINLTWIASQTKFENAVDDYNLYEEDRAI